MQLGSSAESLGSAQGRLRLCYSHLMYRLKVDSQCSVVGGAAAKCTCKGDLDRLPHVDGRQQKLAMKSISQGPMHAPVSVGALHAMQGAKGPNAL